MADIFNPFLQSLGEEKGNSDEKGLEVDIEDTLINGTCLSQLCLMIFF